VAQFVKGVTVFDATPLEILDVLCNFAVRSEWDDLFASGQCLDRLAPSVEVVFMKCAASPIPVAGSL
jgi:hypothetical protein